MPSALSAVRGSFNDSASLSSKESAVFNSEILGDPVHPTATNVRAGAAGGGEGDDDAMPGATGGNDGGGNGGGEGGGEGGTPTNW